MTTTESVTTKSNKVYLAVILLAFFAGPTGLARVYRGDKTLGWGRFWTFVGCIVLGMISAALPPLAALVGLVQLGLAIWGAVDFFLLYGVKTDAEGKQLITSVYDRKFAKVFFVLFIIFLALTVVGIIFALIFSSAILSGVMSNYRNPNTYTTPAPLHSNTRSSDLFTKAEAESIKEGMTKTQAETILNYAVGDCSGSTSFEYCTYKSGSSFDSPTVMVYYSDDVVSSALAY